MFYAHGDARARPLRDAELKAVRPQVTDALATYRKSEQIQIALQLTQELLDYQPLFNFSYHHEMLHAMNHLTSNGAGAWDVLRRVIEVYAVIEREPHRFPTPRVVHHALARCTLRLVSLGKWRAKSRLLDYMGELIEQHLGQFSILFLRHIERKFNERAALLRKASTFDEVAR